MSSLIRAPTAARVAVGSGRGSGRPACRPACRPGASFDFGAAGRRRCRRPCTFEHMVMDHGARTARRNIQNTNPAPQEWRPPRQAAADHSGYCRAGGQAGIVGSARGHSIHLQLPRHLGREAARVERVPAACRPRRRSTDATDARVQLHLLEERFALGEADRQRDAGPDDEHLVCSV